MPAQQPSLLMSQHLNNWRLFALVVIPMSVANMLAMTRMDLTSASGVSAMIQFSVRLAVPWLLLAFAASSLVIVFPGRLSRWLLRNRRIIGLCFAAGMAWQLLFILWLMLEHWAYYMEEVYSLVFVVAEGPPAYLLLLAMTITSFRFARSKLKPRHWKLLHKLGIYFLWAYVMSTYWYELFYYHDRQFLNYVFYWAAFSAWAVRLAAWSKQRARHPISPVI